jgi:CubicO group peptidase (beta-lactamase class C family)
MGTRFDETVDRLRVAVEAGAVPGALVVHADPDGTRVAVLGRTHQRGGAPVGERTRFRLASCSKLVTALAALLAVQDGVLDLDAPLRRVVPGIAPRSRFDGDPADQITVRHLLSHMAGLTRQAPIDNTYPSWDDHVASIGDTWLRFPVGTRYAYSDIGIDLVGRVLEVATGEPFPRFVARRVLEPLGMERATFDVAEITADRDRCVGHVQGEEQQITGMVPAGSLYASARDLGAFLRFVIDGGVVAHRRVLSAELLEQWSTTPFPAPGQVEGYALGLRTKRTACGIARGHAGSGFGFFADLWWLQASGEGGAVVVSSQELDVRGSVVPELIGAPDAAPALAEPEDASAPGALDPAANTRRAGRYVGGLHDTVTFEVRHGVLGVVRGNRFDAVGFGADACTCSARRSRERYRFADGVAAPPYVVRLRDGESWTYNDGPNDPPGPDWPSWDQWLGTYTVVARTDVRGRVLVTKRDGYLSIGSQRVLEHSGHWFTSRGEAVARRGEHLCVGRFTLRPVDESGLGADAPEPDPPLRGLSERGQPEGSQPEVSQ